MLRLNFEKTRVGLHFGRFGHHLIRSPCVKPRPTDGYIRFSVPVPLIYPFSCQMFQVSFLRELDSTFFTAMTLFCSEGNGLLHRNFLNPYSWECLSLVVSSLMDFKFGTLNTRTYFLPKIKTLQKGFLAEAVCLSDNFLLQ
jgi:hypothetical protein